MAEATQERLPIFSKKTSKLMCRVSEDGVFIWDKLNKAWELFTWEELRAKVEAQKAESIVV
jgi:hypothetical protein